MRLVSINAMQGAMGKMDPGFVEWGMGRLVQAQPGSTIFVRGYIRWGMAICSASIPEVAEGGSRVAEIVE